LNETIDAFIEKASQLGAEKDPSTSNADVVSSFSLFVKAYGLRKMLGNMEADMMEVAAAIGYFTKRRTRRRVNELTIRFSEDLDEIVDQFLDSLAQFVGQNSTTPASKENQP